MKSPYILLAAVLMVSVLTVNGSAPDDRLDGSVSSAQAMARLRKGEILVENVHTGESGGSVRVQALMYSELQEIWDFIASCDSVFLYLHGVRSCELLKVEYEENSDTTTLRQRVKKSWVLPTLEYIIVVRRQPPSRIDFKLLEGDLKNMEGGWRFETLAGEPGVVVTHEIRIRPKFPVPRWLLRRSMRKDVPDMLACLRGLTNGSGQFSRDKDLRRCPKQRKKR